MRVLKRPAAKRDLIRHFVWLAENASIGIARRFRDSAQRTFDQLAALPGLGAVTIHHGSQSGLRMWRIRGFEN